MQSQSLFQLYALFCDPLCFPAHFKLFATLRFKKHLISLQLREKVPLKFHLKMRIKKKIKSPLCSPYYAEARNDLRDLSPRLSAWATQLPRNVATVASRWRHCVDRPGNRTLISRTDSVRLATELTASNKNAYNNFKFWAKETFKSSASVSLHDLAGICIGHDKFSTILCLLQICSSFQASSADCERAFSLINTIKSNNRCRLDYYHLNQLKMVKFVLTMATKSVDDEVMMKQLLIKNQQ